MSLLLDLIDSQNNAKPAPKAIKSTGSLLLDSIDKLPAASPNDGVPPSSLTAVESPVDPIDAQIARNNAFKSKADGILTPPPDAFEIANQVTQQANTSNNIENAMAMQPAPSAMVAPVQLGRDGVNPVSVFNPLPVDNAQIVQNEMSAIEQQPMATQERADAGLFNPNRDFGRAVAFGRDTAQSNVKNLVADAESVLRETAPMQMMQTMQNAALPVVNPIREFFGAAPLPENANEKASIAAEAAAKQDATRLMDQAKAMGYRQMTTDDIDNFGDFLDWAKTSLGSSGEPMLVSLATGGWMSPLLMAGEYNTNLKEIKGLSKEKRLALASSGGLVAGFLENVGLGILVKGMPKELVGKLGGKWFAEKVSKHFGGRIAAAVLSGMVAEGLVEGAQEGIGIGLEASVGKNFKQGEVWTRFKESMAAGAVVGGGIRLGVQTGTETVGGVQSAITPDPLISDDEKTVAGFIAADMLNPANAQLTEVKTEGEPTGSLLLDAIQRAEEFAAPVQAAEAAPVVEQPVVEQPVVEQPVVEQPVVEPVAVEPAPAAEQVFTSKTVPQMIGGQPSTDPRETLTAISDGTNTRYITHVDDEGWVEVDEAGTELEKQPSFWMDSASQKKQAIEFMQEEMAAPAAETAPAVQPVAQPAPAAEQANPQAQPVIPFARPVADTDGQQKTLTIRTPNSEQTVEVKPFIIDLADLKQAKGIFQPRDRTTKESDVGVRERAKDLDPAQLMESPVTSFGAPIIARDGTIISGNGRVLSLELAKNEYPDQYANYKQTIEGYGTSDQNYETPILVMMLDQDMTSQELSKFADISNAPSQAAFSATEAARKDAKNIGIDIFDLYRPESSLDSAANQDFVNTFIQRTVAESERGSMTRQGLLTKPGMDRINAAILASAYNDTSILATFLEDTDNKVKSIGDAYLAAAPKLAILKSRIQNGEVAPEFDVTQFMVEAAQVIAQARKDQKPLVDILGQQSMFGSVEMSPETQALVTAFYTDGFGRAKSKKEITELLEFFSQEAQNMSAQGAGMFVDNTTPAGLIQESSRRARVEAEKRAKGGKKDDPNQGKLLQETDGTGKRPKQSGEQVQKPRVQRGGQGLKEADTASIKARLDDAERTRRAEVASEETVETTEDSVLAVSDLDSQRTEKPGTLVDKVSMRRFSSLQGQAFRDAGITPAIGKNMPIERQFKILSDLMKNKFGLAHVVKTDKANKKEAVDQLLAGYHNLNNLAYELGLPTQAMGLGGTLSFVAAADTGAYGTYSPSEQTITLPRRSNSFAHEWFHALDHYLLEKYGSGETTKVPLATEAVRKYGNEAFAPDAPTGVKESYFALMRALFKDKASEATQLMAIDQKMAGMEQRAAKSGKDVSAMTTYQKLKAQKQRILESTGKSRKVGKSQMRKDAEFFAEIIDQGVDYWASPAEMGARAFEAFAISKVTNAGLQTAFLGKTDEAYTMTLEQLGVNRKALATPQTRTDMLAVLDSRLALTFPKSDERANIFGAMQNLMEAIRLETELGQGDKAELMDNEFATDMRDLHNVPEKESKGILADYQQARREAKNLAEREKLKVNQYTERYKGKKKAIIGEKGFVIPMKHFTYIEDTFMAPLFYQKQGTLKAMIKRYPNNRRLKRIYQKLGTHTGGELQSTYEGDTLFNAQARQVRVFSERMKNVAVGAEYNMFTQEEVTQLRDILISEENVNASPKVIKLAGQLRDIYNNMYDYLRKSGIDIDYAPNGYVQRILDHAEVSNDTAKFETQARKVYDIVWEQDLGVINEGDLDQMLATIKYIQDARLGIEERDQRTGDKITLGRQSDYKNFVESTAWTDIKDLLGALKIERKKDNPDQAQIESLEAELEQQAAAIAPQFEQFYNAMKRHFSYMKSYNWRQSINHSHVGGSVDGSPQASFAKKRKLPPEADKLMEQFYISDPIENLTNYILSAVRKAEYSRRFGKHLIPSVANKNEYTDLLDFELKQLTDRDGITATEVNEIEHAISNMLGRNMDGKMPTMLQKGSNRVAAALSITLLIRAPIASIAEPFTVGLTSGSAMKGLMSFASTLQEFPGLRNLGNAQEDIRIRHQFARIMGIIDDPEVGDIMTNRIGGEFAGDPKISKIMASFFAKIKLSGITNAQRRSAAKIGFQYITEMAYEIKNPSSLRNQKRARRVMQDLGVADSRMAQFVDYVLSFNEHNDKGNFVGKMKLPTANEVFANESGEFSDMGMQLAVSIMRFTDQSIQDPRTVDRPLWAENGIGRIVYGITSFIYSFQDKVLKPMFRRTAREYGMSKSEGKGRARSGMDAGLAAAQIAAIPLASLFTAHALVSAAREYIFNQDRWDREWEEAEEDEVKFIRNYLLPLAFTRSGLTGAFDPLFQAFTGLKYQRDIANTFLGTGGYVAQNIQDIAKYWINNSENTVSNEFKALRGIYNLTVNPAASLLLAASNLTPATAYVGTGAAMTVTSTDFKNAMINRWLNYYYGQTYTPGKAGRKSKSKIYTNK